LRREHAQRSDQDALRLLTAVPAVRPMPGPETVQIAVLPESPGMSPRV
jgi:hypothetical protein